MKQQLPPRPSIRQILWTDYTAFFVALIPIVIWIVFLAWVPDWRRDNHPVISPQLRPFVLYFNLVLTVVTLVILFRRVRLLLKVFRDGAQVRGRITSFSMRRDRGQVEYIYIFDRDEYRSGVAVHRNKQTLALKVGDRVILMVDPDRPQRAFIRDLYVEQ